MTKKILTRLRFPAKTADAVSHLVAEHMFHYESAWSDAAVRRFIVPVGPEPIDDTFDLRRADIYGMKKEPVRLHGDDLVKAGIPAGKEMGRVLKELFDTVLDDPKENTKEKLLAIAQNIYRKTGTETK